MAARIGITPDIETSKWEIDQKFKNARNWKVTNPFTNKKEAQDWEAKKIDELNVETVKQQIETKRIRVEWRGFYFEHDGPKR